MFNIGSNNNSEDFFWDVAQNTWVYQKVIIPKFFILGSGGFPHFHRLVNQPSLAYIFIPLGCRSLLEGLYSLSSFTFYALPLAKILLLAFGSD
jgi:hypothetical protein